MLESEMEKHQYDIRKGVNVSKVTKDENTGKLTVQLDNGMEEEEVDQVILAVGRTPNTDNIGKENIEGLEWGKNGNIITNEFEETGADQVYAIGDVTDKLQLTPVAIKAGRCLVERLFNNKPGLKLDYEGIPTVVFSHPPMGTLGLTTEAAIEKYGEDDVKVYKSVYVNMFYSMMDS